MSTSSGRLTAPAAGVVAVLALVVLRIATPAQTPAPFAVTPLAAPAGVGSASPQLSSHGPRTILSWLEQSGASTALRFAERTADGWTTVRTVTSGSQLLMNAADVASVHLVSDRLYAAQWLQENGGDGESYDLRVAWSKDGRTWSPPVSPHHDGAKVQHGFASVYPVAGGFGLIWLDGRGGDMALRATSFTAAGVQAPEVVVDARVCECCQTAAATTTEGVVVAFRNRDPNEIRDIFVSRRVGQKWTAPAPVFRDGWRLEGCPVNGPAVAARGRTVAVAWFTGQSGTGKAFAAFSRDAGRTFGKPIALDDGAAGGRVQIVMTGDGAAVASWVEVLDGRSTVRARRIDAAGLRSPPVIVADAIARHYPRLAVYGAELVFAWVELTRGTTRVRTARAALK